MYGSAAALIGALVTIMSDINSRLAGAVGAVAAAGIIHSVGLAAILAISALVPALRRRRGRSRGEVGKGRLQKAAEGRPSIETEGTAAGRPGRDGVTEGPGFPDVTGPGTDRRTPAPWYLYLGGTVGVGTVMASNFAFAALGASLAVAVSLLGQTLFSLAADASGLLGRKRYPLSLARIPGIAIALAGVALMAEDWRLAGPAAALAFSAGLCAGLSAVLNAELAERRDVLHSSRANYATGLATVALVALAVGSPLPAPAELTAAGPLLLAGGGLIGIVVVSALNIIFPRIPVFAATILMFSGQTAAGVVVDAIRTGDLELRKVLGTGVLLAGLAVDAAVSLNSRKARTGAAPSGTAARPPSRT